MRRTSSDGKLIRQFSRILREFNKEHKVQTIGGNLTAVIRETSGFGFDTLLVWHSPTVSGQNYVKAKLIHANGTIHNAQMEVEFIAWSGIQIIEKLQAFRFMYMVDKQKEKSCNGKCHVVCPLCLENELNNQQFVDNQ
ncbi:MAG: hypothetical protein RLO17_14680 [Cyclobacteriaceae bacterium]